MGMVLGDVVALFSMVVHVILMEDADCMDGSGDLFKAMLGSVVLLVEVRWIVVVVVSYAKQVFVVDLFVLLVHSFVLERGYEEIAYIPHFQVVQINRALRIIDRKAVREEIVRLGNVKIGSGMVMRMVMLKRSWFQMVEHAI